MKITRLELRSFRSFVDTTLDLDAPRVFICGVNEAGKSSVREAIRWLLTGKAKDHDGATLDQEGLAPAGIEPLTVSVSGVVDPLGSMARTIGEPGHSRFQVGQLVGTPAGQQQALYDTLGTSEPFLHAILDTSTFLRLHHAEAKALVLGLLNVVVHVGKGTAPDECLSLDQLDAAYKTAFEDRRIAKAKLKTLSIPASPEGSFATIPAIEARLEALRVELAVLHQQVGVTVGHRQRIQSQIHEHAGRISAVLIVPADATRPGQIADLEARIAIREAAIDDIAEAMPTLPSNRPTRDLNALRYRAEALTTHQPKQGCVLDAEIACPVHKLKFTNRAKDILADLDKEASRPELTPDTVNPLTVLRKELACLKHLQVESGIAAASRANQQAEVDQLSAELSALPDTAIQEAEIATLQERIQKGEAILKAATAHQEAVRRRDLALKAQAAQTADVARLEALCEEFGPSGARVQALATALGPFEQAINAFTGAFGWQVAFHVEPWGVVVNNRPVETYSKSAQYRIGIALQLAIAKLSGLSFAIVDELDMLDAANRERVGQMLLASDLDQVILLGTREASSPLPVVAGMLAYRLDRGGGRSTILERTGR